MPARYRRIRLRLMAMTVVLLVLSGAGYLFTIGTQRLEPGFLGYEPVAGFTADVADHTAEFRFPFRPNTKFVLYASVRNPGPWPVVLTDLSLNDFSPYFAVKR